MNSSCAAPASEQNCPFSIGVFAGGEHLGAIPANSHRLDERFFAAFAMKCWASCYASESQCPEIQSMIHANFRTGVPSSYDDANCRRTVCYRSRPLLAPGFNPLADANDDVMHGRINAHYQSRIHKPDTP